MKRKQPVRKKEASRISIRIIGTNPNKLEAKENTWNITHRWQNLILLVSCERIESFWNSWTNESWSSSQPISFRIFFIFDWLSLLRKLIEKNCFQLLLDCAFSWSIMLQELIVLFRFWCRARILIGKLNMKDWKLGGWDQNFFFEKIDFLLIYKRFFSAVRSSIFWILLKVYHLIWFGWNYFLGWQKVVENYVTFKADNLLIETFTECFLRAIKSF